MKALKDFQAEAIHRKISFALVVVGGVVLIAGVGLIAKFGDLSFINSKIDKKMKEKRTDSKTISISGVPACLPLKSGEPVEKTDCKYGIKTEKGEFYAISSSASNPLSLYGEAGSSGVEFSGEFSPAQPDEKYDIVGTISA